MLHALTVLAASAGSEGESSKTVFYICGGLLAAWAVLLSGIGMSQATFPATATAKRTVLAISALLVVAAMATAVITA